MAEPQKSQEHKSASERVLRLVVSGLHKTGLWGVLRHAYSNPVLARPLSVLANFLFSSIPHYRGVLASQGHVTNENVLMALLKQAHKPVHDLAQKRIVLITATLSPGGTERQVVNTAIGLKHKGYNDIHLVCQRMEAGHPDRQDFYRGELEESGISPVNLARYFRDHVIHSNDYKSLQAFRKELGAPLFDDVMAYYSFFKDMKPQTVHSFLDWANISAGLGALLASVPLIVLSGRNVSPPNFELPFAQMHVVYTFLLQHPNVLMINNSRAGAEDYANWLDIPVDRIGVLRNGLKIENMQTMEQEMRKVARYRFGIPENALVIGGVFRLMVEKRPLLWIEAATIIAREQPNVFFVLFGDGALKTQVQRLAQKAGISSRLKIFNPVNPVSDIFAAIDLMLLTSAQEGTPNVIIEAQWYGTPVVTTNVGGVSETIMDGMSGVLVNSECSDEIARQVLIALQHLDDFKGNRDATHRFILEQFGFSRMIEETISLYKNRSLRSG